MAAVPFGSTSPWHASLQAALQGSPGVPLAAPSSHCSGGMTIPSPQMGLQTLGMPAQV